MTAPPRATLADAGRVFAMAATGQEFLAAIRKIVGIRNCGPPRLLPYVEMRTRARFRR
jgi:hypothetical protein